MPVLTRSQAIVKQPLAHVASSRAILLGGSQPHHQGFLNNLSWKEVSSTVKPDEFHWKLQNYI